MDDVSQSLARERLSQDLKGAKPKRQLIRDALRTGTSAEFLSLRYSVPLDHILSAKLKWEREDAAELKRREVKCTIPA